MFVHRARVLLAVVLVGVVLVGVWVALVSACGGSSPAPFAAPSAGSTSSPSGGTDVSDVSPEGRWWRAVEEQTDECMADAGFPEYGLVPPWARDPGARSAEEWLESVEGERRDAARAALLGAADPARVPAPTPTLTPTWRETGCAGRAIHEVGAD